MDEEWVPGSRRWLVVLSVVAVGSTVAVVWVGILGTGSVCACSPPAAEFEFAVNQSASTVTITHVGGDDFPAAEVFVTVDGERQRWTEQGSVTQQTAAGGGAVVSTGDSYVVRGANPGAEIRVVWSPSDSPNSMTLAGHDLAAVTDS